MEIKCEFSLTSWNIGMMCYTCNIKSAQITERNTRIAAFVGNHLPGKTNEDVVAILFQRTSVEYFPHDLTKIFPNLKACEIRGCRLKEITKQDLVGLEGLTFLWLPSNLLESLPRDLLESMKSLTHVSFETNMLKSVDSQMFDHIKHQVISLRFSDNPKICAVYEKHLEKYGFSCSSIDELLETIDRNFSNSQPYIEKPSSKVEDYFQDNIKQLWSSKRFSDIIVCVEKKEFKVHKTILGAQSPVFAAIFESDMGENGSGKVIINDFSAGAVEEFLQFFYTGEIPNETNAMEVFTLASKYDVEVLQLKMDEAGYINCKNAVEILKVGNLYNSEVLKTKAFNKVKLLIPELNLKDHMKNKPENIEKLIETRLNYMKTVTALLKL